MTQEYYFTEGYYEKKIFDSKIYKYLSLGCILILICVLCVICVMWCHDKDMEQGGLEAYEAERSVYTGVDYGNDTVYCIGHKSPDTDTITSAIALAEFLNDLGINAEARACGKPNLETKYLLDKYEINAPQILEDATDCRLYLVDHSASTQVVNGGDKARIVGIVDHHGIGDVSNDERINVTSAPAGATASLVYMMFRKCGFTPSRQTAYMLIGGIISDTSNMTSNVTDLDTLALKELLEETYVDTDALYEEMLEAKLSYEGMTESENDFLVYLVSASGEESYQKIGFAGKNQDMTREIPEAALGDRGTLDGNVITLEEKVSRKEVVVPAINQAIAYLTDE